MFDVMARAVASGRAPAAVLREALADGTLPRRWKAKEDRLVALVGLGELSHVAAGQQLGWSRWTVAEWRRRLGIVGR